MSTTSYFHRATGIIFTGILIFGEEDKIIVQKRVEKAKLTLLFKRYILNDIDHYVCEEVKMDTAKLFTNGRSQAIRLPKAYRFKGKEVFIKKTAEGVLLLPKDSSVWDVWAQNLSNFDEPFIVERDQPEQQDRDGLDDLFD